MNKVETFNKFNQGKRRPNRHRHLELCGFSLTRRIHPEDGKPSKLAMVHAQGLSESKGGFYHAVTLPKRDYDGWIYYEVWTKRI